MDILDIPEIIKQELERRMMFNPIFNAKIVRTIALVDTDFGVRKTRRLSQDEKNLASLIAGTALVLADIPAFMIK